MNGTQNVNNLVIGMPSALPPQWAAGMVSAVVEDSSNLAAVAEVRFRDPSDKFFKDTGVTIGTEVRLRIRRGQRTVTGLFQGEVVAIEREYDGLGTFSVVRAMDRSHRLMRGQRVRSFVQQSPSLIARELAYTAGVPIGVIERFDRTYDMVTQPNVSDWDFLKMLALDNEAEAVMVDGRFCFRHRERAAGAPDTATTADQSPHVVQMDKNVLAVRSSVSSMGQVPTVTVRGWDPMLKRAVKTEVPAVASTEIAIPVTPAAAFRPFGGTGLNIADVPFQTSNETRAVARAVAADVTASLAELEVGVRGRPELRAGVPMTLRGVGAKFDGKYTITSSRHVFTGHSAYETWLTVSGRQDRTIAGLGSGASAPVRPVRVPGLAIGLVTDTKVDADPRSRGRARNRRNQGWVRLRFPWLTDDTAYQSDWVRTVQLGGGGGGGVFVPEINDEVLVGFEQGLLDRPYVIGGLYNGKDHPSRDHQGDLIDPTTGRVNRRSFASRSGDRIELLDSRVRPKGIRLATAKDKLVVYLDRAKSKIVLNSDGSIEIDARDDVEIRGRNITIDASRNLTLKGTDVDVTGALGVDVRAPVVRLN